MKKNYEPRYALGEILVCFKKDYDIKHFVIAISKELGFEYTFEKFNEENNTHVIKVPEGKEKESINLFLEANGRFIQWAEQRDLKFEKRIKFRMGLEKRVNDLEEFDSKKNFYMQLKEIKDYINKF